MEKTIEVLEQKIIELENENKQLIQYKEKLLKTEQENTNLKYVYESMEWKLAKSICNNTNKDLPIPRLEMQFEKISESQVSCIYGMIKRSVVGDIIFYPMHRTMMTSREYIEKLNIMFKKDMSGITKDMISKQLPCRGGYNFEFDAVNLNMPMYVTYNNFYYKYVLSEKEVSELLNINKKIQNKEIKDFEEMNHKTNPYTHALALGEVGRGRLIKTVREADFKPELVPANAKIMHDEIDGEKVVVMIYLV